MGISTTIQITCDYKNCGGTKGPAVITWNKEAVESGREQPTEAAQYLVPIAYKNQPHWFCCQLCCARFFLPPGYEAKQKPVVQFPESPGWKEEEPESEVDWKDLPLRRESPENGISQPDGFGPESV